MIDIAAFADLIFAEVKRLAATRDVPFQYNLATRTYRRSILTVTVSEHHGSAFVSYIRPPSSSLGHSSQAFPFPMTEQGAIDAAAAVVNFLTDTFLIS